MKIFHLPVILLSLCLFPLTASAQPVTSALPLSELLSALALRAWGPLAGFAAGLLLPLLYRRLNPAPIPSPHPASIQSIYVPAAASSDAVFPGPPPVDPSPFGTRVQ